jgi:Protein of unknown function (DUF1573)
MPTLKSYVALFCLCGLLVACANEPKTASQEKTTEDLTSRSDSSEDSRQDTASMTTANQLIPDSIKLLAAARDTQTVNATPVKTKEKSNQTEEEKELKRKAERARKRAEKKLLEEQDKKEGKKGYTKGLPVITFKKTVYDYGRIVQGDKVKYNFAFTNTGDKDLLISNATASCGCTQPSFPYIPIAPGEESYIGVVFDSKGKLGRQKPVITVTTNAKPAVYEIFLEGFVDSSAPDDN